jgi:colicin import membrane protein
MNVLALPRTAVDRSLRIVRLPIDRVIRRDNNRTAAIALTVDRADAAVRRFAGQLLHDDVLREDATERELAANERQRALELRAEAELRARRADEDLHSELDTAKARRETAARRAEEQEKQAEARRREETRRIEERTEERKSATREAAERNEQRIEERARKERLTELERESEVLEAKDDTVTAASEAQRLQRAASEVKSERKSG